MNVDARGPGIGGHTRVIAGVTLLRLSYDKHTAGAVAVHSHAALLVVVDHAFLVIPEHVHGRLRALAKRAHQPQLAAALDMQIRRSQDLGCRF